MEPHNFLQTNDFAQWCKRNKVLIVGMGHRKQVGKDVLLQELCMQLGTFPTRHTVRFATALKKWLGLVVPGVAYFEHDDKYARTYVDGASRPYSVSEIRKTDKLPGSDTTLREALISAGNWAREVLRPDIWIWHWQSNIRDLLDINGDEWDEQPPFDETLTVGQETYMVYTPDVRYENEAQVIHAAGGILVKVERPSVEPSHDVADDALEGYPGWDYTFVNSVPKDSREYVESVAELARFIQKQWNLKQRKD